MECGHLIHLQEEKQKYQGHHPHYQINQVLTMVSFQDIQ